MTEAIDVEYARNGDASIAYQVFGSGPGLLVVPGWASHLEAGWDLPGYADMLRRLGRFARVVVMDRRGSGLSDRFTTETPPPLETHVEDMRAVLRSAGIRQTAILGIEDSGMLACVFAAVHPDLVTSLALYAAIAAGSGVDDYPWQWDRAQWDWFLTQVADGWGRAAFAKMDLQYVMPAAAERPELVDRWARFCRTAASPAAAVALIRQFSETDIRDVLPSIRVPTLLLRHRQDPTLDMHILEYMSERIPDARIAIVEGRHTFGWFEDDMSEVAGVIEEFVTGGRSAQPTDRVLGTVVFLDVVGSTERAAAIGDQAWRDEVDALRASIRVELDRFGGRQVDTSGDGVLASFAGPATAVRFAQAAEGSVRPLGLELRAGVHTGELEQVGSELRGIAVHIGARVMAAARGGQVLATSTVKDLTAGSGLVFEDAGEHELKGVPEPWRLYRVAG